MNLSNVEKGPSQSRTATILKLLIPALGGFQFGYDIGATSFVLFQLQRDNSGVDWQGTVEDKSYVQGLIASGGVGGALIGSLIAFKYGDMMGRRKEMMISSIIFILGTLIELISGSDPHFSANEAIPILLLGRIVFGIALGMVMHASPAYIAEMSPPDLRGFLVGLKEVLTMVGILLGYGIGSAFLGVERGWLYTYGLSIIGSVTLGFGMYNSPESARWLLTHGDTEGAKAAFRYVGIDDADTAVNDALNQIQEDSRPSSPSIHAKASSSSSEEPQSLFSPSNIKAYKPMLISGLGCIAFQQITGQPSVLYYANTIFQDAGLGVVATVGLGVFMLVCTTLAIMYVDNFGRKVLLYAGISCMSLALFALAILFGLSDDLKSDDDGGDDESGSISDSSIAVLIAMFVYIGGFQISFGPVSWLLMSEIFSQEVRSQAMASAVLLNFFFNLIVAFSFPVILDIVGPSTAFAIFCGIAVLSLAHVWGNVIETKGLSLEEIQVLYSNSGKRGATNSNAEALLLHNDTGN